MNALTPPQKRLPIHQPLNSRAMAKKYAEQIGRKYEDLNLLVCTLGGGITVCVHSKGRMIDSQNGVEGDGAFCVNRANGVPSGALVDMCYSGKYTYEEMKKKINGSAGLNGYLGTMDAVEVENRALAGEEKFREVLEAMCYQVSKDIGAFSTVVRGQLDAILLIGGMANSKYITDLIKDRVSFIAPVVVMLGESPADYTIIDCDDEVESARLAVQLVKSGEADIPMKGHMQTSSFMKALLNKDTGITPRGNILSYASIFEHPTEERLVIFTDAAINISPSAEPTPPSPSITPSCWQFSSANKPCRRSG